MVRDAIASTRDIGERYLWVDTLYIVQDDEKEKSKATNRMHTTYMDAYAVIVVAADSDANAGLKGTAGSPQKVRDLSRQQSTFGDGNLLGQSLASSKYETRCWTYQERYLACRRIIFCEEHCFVQCRGAIYRDDPIYESTRIPADVKHHRDSVDNISPDDYIFAGEAFRDCVRAYSKRELNYADDILFAFAGILNYYAIKLGTSMWCGLPQSMLALALCWRLVPPYLKREARRPEISSWSWCGWCCQVRLPRVEDDTLNPRLWTMFEISDDETEFEQGYQEAQALENITESTIDQVSTIGGEAPSVNNVPTMEDLSSRMKTLPSTVSQVRCLTFDTIVIAFNLGPQVPDQSTHHNQSNVLNFSLHDRHGRECGRVQLVATWMFAVGSSLDVLILKDSKHGEEYGREMSTGHWIAEYNRHEPGDKLDSDHEVIRTIHAEDQSYPLYITLTTIPHHGPLTSARERVGIGYVYKQALYRSFQPCMCTKVTLV